MNKEQGQLFTTSTLSKKTSRKKNKKQAQSFVDLTLFKQDLADIVQLFQNHLQDVEIVIDDQRILHSEQLAQFDDAYQAKSLLARGYWPATTAKDGSDQDERLLIELKMSKVMAILSSWEALGKSEFIVQLRKLLLRHTTFVQSTLQVLTICLFASPLYSVISLITRQYINSLSHMLRLFAEIGAGILAMPAFIFLFAFLVTRLKLETRIFLFPGKTTTTRTYHRFSMVSKLLIALILLIFFDGLIVIGFSVLWR